MLHGTLPWRRDLEELHKEARENLVNARAVGSLDCMLALLIDATQAHPAAAWTDTPLDSVIHLMVEINLDHPRVRHSTKCLNDSEIPWN